MPWANIFMSNKQKPKQSEQDPKYPITPLIFMVESQSLCLYPCLRVKEAELVLTFNV